MFSQSDCILAMLIRQEESFQEPSFSRSSTGTHQKAGLAPLWASPWDPLGQPKSIQKHSGSDLQWHHVSHLDFKGWGPPWRRVLCTLEPGPWYPVIYILESSARFARAQFSWTSIWRPRPSLGGTGSAPQTWTLLLVGRGGELGLTIQADNAG